MRLRPAALAALCATVLAFAAPARADVSRFIPLKGPVAVGEVFTIRLAGGIGYGNCDFDLDLGRSADTGFKAGVVEVSAIDNTVYNFRLPGRD